MRIAAAWSWRAVAVVAALYLLLRADGYVAVVVPVIVALLLAALLQPGAARLRRSGWPTALAALTMLVVGVGVVAGIVTLVVEEFAAGYADLVSQVDRGLTRVQDFATRTFPVTDGQITEAVDNANQAIGSFLAGTVSVLVTLVAVGPVRALIALGIIVLIMQLESHVLQPLLLGRAVSVHPLAVVLGIAAGLLIGGVFGALIAVPVIACGNVAGTYLSRRHEGPRPPQPDTRRAKRLVTTA